MSSHITRLLKFRVIYGTSMKTIELFTSSEKRRAIFIVFLVVSMAFFEAVGIASVIPFWEF